MTIAAAIALSSALPAQSLPQWVTIKGAEKKLDIMYDLNSLKALPNGIKQIDTYYPSLKTGFVMYISCPRWRNKLDVEAEWKMIPPDTLYETLAYKVCGKN